MSLDLTKLESLISAIDEEAVRPSPSHQNLARLVSMFFKELLESQKYQAPEPPPPPPVEIPVAPAEPTAETRGPETETVTVEKIDGTPVEPLPAA